MKLDNILLIMHGSFHLYSVELRTLLRRSNMWCVIENESVVRASITSTHFSLVNDVARGTILHGNNINLGLSSYN